METWQEALLRFALYGFFGWGMEIVFTGIFNALKKKDLSLKGTTSIMMFPIYGIGVLLFEQAAAAFEHLGVSAPTRFSVYEICLYGWEYATGMAYYRMTGSYLWYYDGPWHINHVITIAYAPLWLIMLIFLEAYVSPFIQLLAHAQTLTP